MITRHREVVPESAEGGASGSTSVWRDIVLASVVVCILFLGLAGGAAAPQISNAELRTPEIQINANSYSAAPQDFVYFPSQYVNQGNAIEADYPTF